MKAYSVDLREKIVKAHLAEKMSIRKVAIRFAVSKSLVQKLVKLQQTEGNLQPKQRGKPQFSHLTNAAPQVKALVSEHPDATLVELCELFALKTGNWVSQAAMCRCLQKLGLNRKKKTWYSSQAATERVQKLRVEYWEKIKQSEPENLVFLDETGILLGLARTYARSHPGEKITELKPFYRAAKVTAIGAISINKVLALMTMNDSMDGRAFAVFIEKFLCPQLWPGAVVVMDNLPAHKLASIEPMIQSVGASVICLSPYSPDFNPIEQWWSQLKSFLRKFAPTTTSMIDRIIAVALHLISPQHLRNWES